MKKYIFLLFINLSSIILWGQSKYSIAVTGGPDYSYRAITGDHTEKSMINASGKAVAGYRAGIDFGITCNKHIGLKTGIRYLHTGYGTKKIQLSDSYIKSGGQMMTDPDANVYESRMKYTYNYIEVPLGIRYQWGHQQLSWYTEAGGIVNVYLSNQVKNITNMGTATAEEDKKHFNKPGFSCYLAFGAQYRMNQHFQAFLQPTARYSITALNNNGPLKYHLYSIGTEIGIRYLLP